VRKLFLIGIVLMTLLSPPAFARGPAMVVVGPGFGPYGWYGSYYGPYPYGPYLVANVGQVSSTLMSKKLTYLSMAATLERFGI
jgi:hypothetical protein